MTFDPVWVDKVMPLTVQFAPGRERERENKRASERARDSEQASERARERARARERERERERASVVPLSSNPCSVAPSTLAHAARMPHSARAAAVRTPMPTTRARQAYAHPPRFLRPGAHPLPPRPTETLQCRPRRGRALTPPAQTLRTPQCTPPVTALPGPRTPPLQRRAYRMSV